MQSDERTRSCLNTRKKRSRTISTCKCYNSVSSKPKRSNGGSDKIMKWFKKLANGLRVFQLLSRVWLFVTPWIIACQAPLSMGFSRQEYWSGLPSIVIRKKHGMEWGGEKHFFWIMFGQCQLRNAERWIGKGIMCRKVDRKGIRLSEKKSQFQKLHIMWFHLSCSLKMTKIIEMESGSVSARGQGGWWPVVTKRQWEGSCDRNFCVHWLCSRSQKSTHVGKSHGNKDTRAWTRTCKIARSARLIDCSEVNFLVVIPCCKCGEDWMKAVPDLLSFTTAWKSIILPK